MSKHWREIQREDLENEVKKDRLKALTANQGVYMKAIETSTVTICTGPPGTGKTYIPCGIAANMFRERRVGKLILTRPMVTCGTGLGFLKGDLYEKTSPYMRPLLDALGDFINPNELEKAVSDGRVELLPMELMRGTSLKNTFIIADEAQNASYAQLHMLLTRFGEGSRVVVTGDLKQSDIGGGNALAKVCRRLKGNQQISLVKLGREDIVRHGLVGWIDARLSADEKAWYSLTCPNCGKLIWYDNGDETQEDFADVTRVKCYKCFTPIDLFDEKDEFNPYCATNDECCQKTYSKRMYW